MNSLGPLIEIISKFIKIFVQKFIRHLNIYKLFDKSKHFLTKTGPILSNFHFKSFLLIFILLFFQ